VPPLGGKRGTTNAEATEGKVRLGKFRIAFLASDRVGDLEGSAEGGENEKEKTTIKGEGISSAVQRGKGMRRARLTQVSFLLVLRVEERRA